MAIQHCWKLVLQKEMTSEGSIGSLMTPNYSLHAELLGLKAICWTKWKFWSRWPFRWNKNRLAFRGNKKPKKIPNTTQGRPIICVFPRKTWLGILFDKSLHFHGWKCFMKSYIFGLNLQSNEMIISLSPCVTLSRNIFRGPWPPPEHWLHMLQQGPWRQKGLN